MQEPKVDVISKTADHIVLVARLYYPWYNQYLRFTTCHFFKPKGSQEWHVALFSENDRFNLKYTGNRYLQKVNGTLVTHDQPALKFSSTLPLEGLINSAWQSIQACFPSEPYYSQDKGEYVNIRDMVLASDKHTKHTTENAFRTALRKAFSHAPSESDCASIAFSPHPVYPPEDPFCENNKTRDSSYAKIMREYRHRPLSKVDSTQTVTVTPLEGLGKEAKKISFDKNSVLLIPLEGRRVLLYSTTQGNMGRLAQGTRYNNLLHGMVELDCTQLPEDSALEKLLDMELSGQQTLVFPQSPKKRSRFPVKDIILQIKGMFPPHHIRATDKEPIPIPPVLNENPIPVPPVLNKNPIPVPPILNKNPTPIVLETSPPTTRTTVFTLPTTSKIWLCTYGIVGIFFIAAYPFSLAMGFGMSSSVALLSVMSMGISITVLLGSCLLGRYSVTHHSKAVGHVATSLFFLSGISLLTGIGGGALSLFQYPNPNLHFFILITTVAAIIFSGYLVATHLINILDRRQSGTAWCPTWKEWIHTDKKQHAHAHIRMMSPLDTHSLIGGSRAIINHTRENTTPPPKNTSDHTSLDRTQT